MAFKSFSQYQEEKNGDFFTLPNDQDSAEVVFLYTKPDDVMVGDVHYIMSSSYKGYAHCCGKGCPACSYGDRGIKLDHKIFIPLYNIGKNKIEFWDRNTFFEAVLQRDVFKNYPNPSEIVFRITRNGEAGSRDTRYAIEPIGRNTYMPYEKILSTFNVSFPDSYSIVCKEMSIEEMRDALYSTGASELGDYTYTPVPRGGAAASAVDYSPLPTVETPSYSAPPEVAPPTLPDFVPGDSASALPDFVPGAPAVTPLDSESDLGVDPATSLDATDDSDDSLDDVKF